MRESGEPMELGIFDFYNVFSRTFLKGVMGQLGFEWKLEDAVNDPGRALLSPGYQGRCSVFCIFQLCRNSIFLFKHIVVNNNFSNNSSDEKFD